MPTPDERAAFVMELMNQFPDKKFTLKHLSVASGDASRQGRNMMREILDTLMDSGAVEIAGHGKYRIARANLPEYEGRVEASHNGSIFVLCEGDGQSVHIDRRNSMNALDGDTVRYVVRGRTRSGAPDGEVTAIVSRSPHPYVGIAEVDGRTMFIRPLSRKLATDIYLSKKKYPEIKDGDKVSVRITDWPKGSNRPVGELVELLGRPGDNDTEMHAILAEYDLPYSFDEDTERAAAEIPAGISEKEYASRRDFRPVTTFTIDPTDAKDFDDALSLRSVGEGVWELGVHIADVTHYVRPGSLLDREAQMRGTSVYLVDRTVPMLPERLSNELCSLRPHEESLCFSAVFTINEKLEILDEWFGRTVIYSDRRFDYAEAQRIIETGEGDFAVEILTLHRLAQGLRRERFRHGAVAFARSEAKFELDAAGHPTGIYFKEQKESNQLIEEFMLLANRRVAEFCGRRRTGSGRSAARTMVYRVHDNPDEEKLSRFRSFVTRFGLEFKAQSGRAVAREMNAVFDKLKGHDEENAVTVMAIRSMAKACYSTDNIGHYGLAFDCYTHFTSPIRRYPDMMVHRLLAHYLAGGSSAAREELEALCVHCSERETIAAEAERASVKYKIVEYMSDKIGCRFEGHISGLADWGVYVELDDSCVEGVAMLRDVEGDFWQFDERRYEIFGARTGRTFTLGDRVLIEVRRADLQHRQLDFEIVEFL